MKEEKALFIDESGKVHYSHASKYFILSGCVLPTSHLQEVRNRGDRIIFKYWGSSRSFHRKYKIKNNIVFRAKQIFNCDGVFLILKDPKTKKIFWNDIYSQLISRLDITYFIVLVDKEAFKKSHPSLSEKESAKKMLFLSYTKILDAFVKYLVKTNSSGEIIAESSSDQDQALVSSLSYMQKNSKTLFSSPYLVNDKITSLSLVNKNENSIGAQVADLMAWTGANKFYLDSKIKKKEDLRFEEKKLLNMYNKRLSPRKSKNIKDKFIVITS